MFSQINVESVTVTGNDYLTRTEIFNMMITARNSPLSMDQYLLDLKTIRDRYKSLGFLFMKFENDPLKISEDSSSAEIELIISEGKRIKVGEINITGNKSFSREKILSGFETKAGDVLNDAELNRDIVSLLKSYEKAGLPFAKIIVKDISVNKSGETDNLNIDILIDENTRITIDQIRIKGNETTKDYVIARELDLDEKNKIVDTESLLEIKENSTG
ncbi:MAG: hypothetical protein IPM38_00265 [Ignavibacteria bacterium]|nr:hypothetical protein [Ignavibacteria bacterium]